MKLAPRTFLVQWELHAWVSVTASLLLFSVCFTGLFSLVFDELMVWQEPALREAPAGQPGAGASTDELSALLPALARHAPIAPGSRVRLHFMEHTPYVAALIQHPVSRAMETRWVHAASGKVLGERTRLAFELYLLHFFYRLPGGMQITGLLGVALLVALVSGVALQLKHLWRQRWQFRPALRARTWASDMHKVLGVFGLPFATIMAWSGAFIGLGTVLGGSLALSNYGGDRARVFALHGIVQPQRKLSDEPAALAPLAQLVTAARTETGHSQLESIDVRNYGDQSAWVQVTFHGAPFAAKPYVQLDGQSGALLGRSEQAATPSRDFANVLFELHFAHYGGALLKLLYSVLALALCAVVLTGNLIWLERRDALRKARSTRVLERLTVGTSCGLVLAAGLMFLANRLLPSELAWRADLECGLFYGAWLSSALACLWPRLPVRRAAAQLLACASASFGAALVMDLARRPVLSESSLTVQCLILSLTVLAGFCARLFHAQQSAPLSATDGGRSPSAKATKEVPHAESAPNQIPS